MNDDDRRNLHHELVGLEAEHGERVLRAMKAHVRNLDDWPTALESGRAVWRMVPDDEPSPAEAAELVALADVFPFTHPRRWGDTPMIVEGDGEA